MNDTYSGSSGLHAFCSISSRRQLAVVMGNEEPESKRCGGKPNAPLPASCWLVNVCSFLLGDVVPLISSRQAKQQFHHLQLMLASCFQRYGAIVKQSSGQAGPGAKLWSFILSEARRSQSHLIDASNQVDTVQREWRCRRSRLPAISEIHAVTFFPPRASPSPSL
jgi:hypothetical protein